MHKNCQINEEAKVQLLVSYLKTKQNKRTQNRGYMYKLIMHNSKPCIAKTLFVNNPFV